MNATVQKNDVDAAFELYEQIHKRAKDDGIAKLLFQELWRGQRTGKARADRPGSAEKQAEGSSTRIEYASAKQIRFLESLGVRLEPPYKLSKQEASKMLEERLGKAA